MQQADIKEQCEELIGNVDADAGFDWKQRMEEAIVYMRPRFSTDSNVGWSDY